MGKIRTNKLCNQNSKSGCMYPYLESAKHGVLPGFKETPGALPNSSRTQHGGHLWGRDGLWTAMSRKIVIKVMKKKGDFKVHRVGGRARFSIIAANGPPVSSRGRDFTAQNHAKKATSQASLCKSYYLGREATIGSSFGRERLDTSEECRMGGEG